MSKPLVNDFDSDHFKTSTEQVGRTIVTRLTGNADTNVQPNLGTLIDQIDGAARRILADELVVDVRDLYFMSSSCLAILVKLITRASQAEKYKIRFVSNPNLRWQKRSLSAIVALGSNIATLE